MAINTISQLTSAINEGARSNQFKVEITTPTGVTLTNASLLCKSAQVPEFTIGRIEVPIAGGRRFYIPGDRTFAEWTATFIVNSSMGIRTQFETWLDKVRSGNFATTTTRASTDTSTYFGTIKVLQLNAANAPVKTYTLQNAFPNDLSAIDVSYDTTDAIEEFTVTFAYTYHTVA